MKKFLMAVFLMVCVGNGVVAHNAQQQLPVAVSDDAELLFDEAPDALDAVTGEDCACSPIKNADAERTTLLQSCYQAALLYLLSSYFSLKYSCVAAKQYIASMLAWTPTTSSETSSSQSRE